MDKPQDLESYYDLYLDYMQSNAWNELRTKRLIKDDFACRLCGNRNNLQVHHLIYPKHSEFGSEPLNDLLTLCESCHRVVEKLKKGQVGQYKQWHDAKAIAQIRLEDEQSDDALAVMQIIRDSDKRNKGIIEVILYGANYEITRRTWMTIDINAFMKIRDIIGEDNTILKIS